jgi:hypothetical protein
VPERLRRVFDVGAANRAVGPTPGTNFTAFTKELLRIQSDSVQPVALSSAQFVFSDDDNPQAFAGVLPAT